MGPYRTPGSVLADEPKKKLEKLTFTPARLIEIERRGEFDEEPWGNVLLKPGREVTFAPCSDWFDDDDWYIDDKRIHRVLHCDVERVHAQLSMEADVAAKAAPAAESVPDRLLRIAREAGYEPTGVEHISVDRWMVLFERPTLGTYVRGVCVGSGKDDKNTLDMLRDYAGPDNQPEAVYNRKLNACPCDTRHPPEEHEMEPYGGHCVKCWRTGEYMEATRSLPKTKPATVPVDKATTGTPDQRFTAAAEYLRTRYRREMVDTIIAEQVSRGGVDTDGTRAQAERWCAMLAGCVCEGMRATTWRSRYRETGSDYEGAVTAEIIDGHIAKPLGRP